MAILSQLAIVIGVVLIGLRHFDNIRAGIAAATLYLLLPYTAMWTGAVTHALPAALLVWAMVLYRRPLFAGAMIGLAFGTIYYPMFLLPLWISFYWQKGMCDSCSASLAMVALMVASLAFTSSDMQMFLAYLKQMFGVQLPSRRRPLGALAVLEHRLSLPDHRSVHVGLSISLVALAGAEESRHADQLLRGADAAARSSGTPTAAALALAWYLPLLAADNLPAEFGRPRRDAVVK